MQSADVDIRLDINLAAVLPRCTISWCSNGQSRANPSENRVLFVRQSVGDDPADSNPDGPWRGLRTNCMHLSHPAEMSMEFRYA